MQIAKLGSFYLLLKFAEGNQGTFGASNKKESPEGVLIGFKGGWVKAPLTKGGIPFGG